MICLSNWKTEEHVILHSYSSSSPTSSPPFRFSQLQATLEVRVAVLEADVADFRKRYEEEKAKLEEEQKLHAITKESVPKLEKMIAVRDADIESSHRCPQNGNENEGIEHKEIQRRGNYRRWLEVEKKQSLCGYPKLNYWSRNRSINHSLCQKINRSVNYQ